MHDRALILHSFNAHVELKYVPNKRFFAYFSLFSNTFSSNFSSLFLVSSGTTSLTPLDKRLCTLVRSKLSVNGTNSFSPSLLLNVFFSFHFVWFALSFYFSIFFFRFFFFAVKVFTNKKKILFFLDFWIFHSHMQKWHKHKNKEKLIK